MIHHFFTERANNLPVKKKRNQGHEYICRHPCAQSAIAKPTMKSKSSDQIQRFQEEKKNALPQHIRS